MRYVSAPYSPQSQNLIACQCGVSVNSILLHTFEHRPVRIGWNATRKTSCGVVWRENTIFLSFFPQNDIFFYTIRPIPANEELLVWYCREFAERLNYPSSVEQMIQRMQGSKWTQQAHRNNEINRDHNIIIRLGRKRIINVRKGDGTRYDALYTPACIRFAYLIRRVVTITI